MVLLLGANHLLMRIPGFMKRFWLFLPVQLLNLGTGAWLMAVGIPEFNEDDMLWFLNWVLGLLLIFHIIQNNMRLQRKQQQKGRPTPSQVRAEQARIEEALRKSKDADSGDAPESDADDV